MTPATQGYAMQLRLSSGGRADLFQDGVLTKSAAFELGTGARGGMFAERDVIRFTPALFITEEMSVALTGGDRLELADGCCDGFAYTFARTPALP
jgi:hypothetical protein